MQFIFHLDLDGTDQPSLMFISCVSFRAMSCPKVIAAVSCPHWAVYRLVFTGPQSTRLQVTNLLRLDGEFAHVFVC